MAKREHYIDNKEFTKAIIAYNKHRLELESKGNPAEKIPEYIGESIMKIANRLITKRNFSGYTWTEEMIDDAIMSMIKAVTKFDPSKLPKDKKPNALAYFTSVANRAFINRIQYENKQLDINEKIVISDVDYRYVLDNDDEVSDFINLDNNNEDLEAIHNKHLMTD